MGFAVLGFAMPVFVLAYVLIYFFAVQWQLLPVQGYVPISEGLWPFAQSLILPSVALGITYMALIARITRASMLEVLQQDYIRTANAKGLATDRVLLLHALKNAAVPIVTVIGIGIALLISGVVITETVFNIPGLGRLTVDAVLKRDYPIVQGLILVFAAAKVLVNLLIDISYAFLDPRIRYSIRWSLDRPAERSLRPPLPPRRFSLRDGDPAQPDHHLRRGPAVPADRGRGHRPVLRRRSAQDRAGQPPAPAVGALVVRHRPVRPRRLHPHRSTARACR